MKVTIRVHHSEILMMCYENSDFIRKNSEVNCGIRTG